VRLLAGRADRLRLVCVLLAAGGPVARHPVGDHDRARLHVVQHERPQGRAGDIDDHLQPAAAKPPTDLLDGHLHHHLALGAPSAHSRLGAAEQRLVSLDDPRQPLAPTSHHRRAVAVQHRPRRLLRAEPERPLQAQRRDPVLLSGHLPSRGKPNRQRRPGTVEDRARRRRHPPAAHPARPATIRQLPPLPRSTHGAAEAIRPPQPVHIVQARRIGRKPRPNISVRARILDPNPRRRP